MLKTWLSPGPILKMKTLGYYLETYKVSHRCLIQIFSFYKPTFINSRYDWHITLGI